ncbi:hypothetical protein Leryth_006108, partial [Lithospermum erythrorhizon]
CELDVDDVGDFEEELERDDFIEVWISFLDFSLEFTQRPLIRHVLSSVGELLKGAKQVWGPRFLRVLMRIDVREEPIMESESRSTLLAFLELIPTFSEMKLDGDFVVTLSSFPIDLPLIVAQCDIDMPASHYTMYPFF